MAGCRPGAGETPRDPTSSPATTKRPDCKLGRRHGHVGQCRTQTRILQWKPVAGDPARDLIVFNRAKRTGRREESRPAGPRGSQARLCQRLPSSGVVPLAQAQPCKLSPRKPGGTGRCRACPKPTRCRRTEPERPLTPFGEGGLPRRGRVPARRARRSAGRRGIGLGGWGKRGRRLAVP